MTRDELEALNFLLLKKNEKDKKEHYKYNH